MARYFLESSALAKRYNQELGTDTVDNLFAGADEYISLKPRTY